ncbi:MAG TPA: choice-of-anchor Q domain-containing protein [Phycisphaerae bacterium]|nr:choice-of-anchor Q domain-containing protein [Phycisphaerae bacterium]
MTGKSRIGNGVEAAMKTSGFDVNVGLLSGAIANTRLRGRAMLACIVAMFTIGTIPVHAGDSITFQWNPQTNDNWGQSSNWIQFPGAGDIPNASNHQTTFYGDAGFGKDVDLQGNTREVESIHVYGGDQYHFRDGTLGNWGRIHADKQVIKFGPSLTYRQLGTQDWHIQEKGGVRMDAVMEGSGNITVNAHPEVTEVTILLNAANTYNGVFRMEIGTTELGDALALQNAKVALAYDDPIDFNGFNPTFGGLSGANALALGSTVLTLDGFDSELSTYSGALTSDGIGQIICATADRYPQEFTGSISNLGVFQVDSGLASLATGTFQFVSPDLSGAIDINGGELSIEDGAEVTATSSNANGGTVNISGGKLSIEDAELYAGRITSVGSGEVALSNTDLGAPGLIIGKNGSLNVSSTFAGKFTGTGSFKKVGTGALTLSGASTLTGEAIIDEGTIVLGTADTLQNTILRSNVTGGLNINGFDPHIGGLRGSTTLDLGNDHYTLGSDGEDASYSGTLTASSTNLQNPSLIKTGSNTQEFTGDSVFSGTVLVESGKLSIAGGGSFAPTGYNEVQASGQLYVVEDATFAPAPWLYVGGLVVVDGGTLDGDIISLEHSTSSTLDITPESTVTATEIVVGRFGGDAAFIGARGLGTTLSASRLNLGLDGGNGFGIAGIADSAEVSISDYLKTNSSLCRLSIDDATVRTNKLIGVGSSSGTVEISDPAGESALTVGTQNGSSTFDGLINDSFNGPGSITKTGTGSFTLSNANTYSGGTVIEGGKLVLGNTAGSATGSGGIAVANGGTLAGNGSANGTTTVASGGTVAPGTSIGDMTLQNATFETGSTLEIEFDMDQHDGLFVTETAELAGTLEIVSLNGLPTIGASFVVLTAGTLTGSFDAVVGPTGSAWSVDYDYVAGTVTVSRCDDADNDGVCDADDICPGSDDNVDSDSDGVPDDCDSCEGFDDADDVDGDGTPDGCEVCPTFPATVSTAQELIDAIHCANFNPDSSTIYLDADITLTAVNNSDFDQGSNGLPSVISPIVIEGQNHVIERDVNAPFFRIFRVTDVPSQGSLAVHDTTLRNGLLDGSVTLFARGGAAVLLNAAELTMNNCSLLDNNGFVQGGAILIRRPTATATLDKVVMAGNSANNGGYGGAIHMGDGHLTVRNSIITGNGANINAGGIVIASSSAQCTIANTIISGNRGGASGSGGISNSGTLTLVNSTLAGNRGLLGGLSTSSSGHSTVVNSLFWGNVSSTELQMQIDGTLDVSYSGIEGGIAGITGSGTVNDNGGNLTLSDTDSVFAAPVDASLAPTTDGDYHLAPGSPAIDQGDNAAANNAGLTLDIDGDDRILNGQVDMGADEYTSCHGDGDDDGDGVCNASDACEGFNDADDVDGDGIPDGCEVCPTFPATVTTAQELIDAMHCANFDPDSSTIYLDADITLTAVNNSDSDQGTNGLPSVISPIVIEGQNHFIERDANAPLFRIFRVSNTPSQGNLTVHDTTLRNGLIDASAASIFRGGAAVLLNGAELTMNNCSLTDNNGFGFGGAILMLNAAATATLDKVYMARNKANNGGFGGAIYLRSGHLTVRNSIITGNSSNIEGGGIVIRASSAVCTIANTIISGNRGGTGDGGGGIMNKGTLTLVNSTLAGNLGPGGGLRTSANGHSIVINSVLWGNADSTELQMLVDGTLDVSYSGIEGGLAGITGSGTVNDNGGNLTLSNTDSVFVAPVDASLAPTTDGDYHLAAGSPAIDQGDNAAANSNGLTVDFEGDDRILNGQVDMGADEYIFCPGDGDDDGDGVCNSVDICPGSDDNMDSDSDGVPNDCDICEGFDDAEDVDGDGIPDGCEVCPTFPATVTTAQELIDAMHCANFDADSSTIYLDADITLTAVNNNDSDQGSNGLPSVISPIVIEGQNHFIERDINAPSFRIFRVRRTLSGGSLTINDATLRNGLLDASVPNFYRGGAAVLVANGDLILNNCALTNNNGLAHGGAILIRHDNTSAALDKVVLTGNQAGDGGAILMGSGQMTIRNSVIAGNTSQSDGSAVYFGSGQYSIANTIISGNQGTSAITNSGTLTLLNSTLAGNNGANGCLSGSGQNTVINSLIWGNAVSPDPQLQIDGTLDVSFSGIEGGIAGITGSGTVNDNGGNLTLSDTDSVFVAPVDASLAPTTDGDYHLAFNSPAIDQGDNAAANSNGLTFDLEGDDRIVNGQVDMGADEYAACSGDGDDDGDGVCNSADVCPGSDDNADADNDGTPDGCDACAGGAGSGDANGDGVVNLDDYPNVSACLTGPGDGLGAGCECFDFDSDGDNDLADFAEFQMEFSGQ